MTTAVAEQPTAVTWRSGARRTKAEIEAERVEMGVPATAAQARLDAIAHPSDDYSRAYLKWINRFSNQPGEYPSEQLVDEAYALGAEIAELKRETENPPEEMTGAEWQERHVRLQRRLGMAKAIADVLQRRAGAERNRTEQSRSVVSKPGTTERWNELQQEWAKPDEAQPEAGAPPLAAPSRQDDQGGASDDATTPDAQTNGDATLPQAVALPDAAPVLTASLSLAGQELRREWIFLLDLTAWVDERSDELTQEQYEARRAALARQTERVEFLRRLYECGDGSPAKVVAT